MGFSIYGSRGSILKKRWYPKHYHNSGHSLLGVQTEIEKAIYQIFTGTRLKMLFSLKITSRVDMSYTLHCKYFDCTQYSFWQCYMCHSIVAVLNTVNDSAQSMAVLNLKCSFKKKVSEFFVVNCIKT